MQHGVLATVDGHHRRRLDRRRHLEVLLQQPRGDHAPDLQVAKRDLVAHLAARWLRGAALQQWRATRRTRVEQQGCGGGEDEPGAAHHAGGLGWVQRRGRGQGSGRPAKSPSSPYRPVQAWAKLRCSLDGGRPSSAKDVSNVSSQPPSNLASRRVFELRNCGGSLGGGWRGVCPKALPGATRSSRAAAAATTGDHASEHRALCVPPVRR